MNKTQFLILNVLALLFLILTGVRFLLIKDLETGRGKLQQAQTVIAKGQQSEQVLRKIILRLAQASQREPDLKDLLKQYNITVSNPGSASSPAPTVLPAPAPTKPKS